MAEQLGPEGTAALAVVHEFVRLTNERRQDQLAQLFADDAEFHAPNGEILHGRPAVAAFFGGLQREYLEPKLPMKPTAIAVDGNQCLLAFQSKLDGVHVHCAVDQFTVDERGKISRFIVYVRPGKNNDDISDYWKARSAET